MNLPKENEHFLADIHGEISIILINMDITNVIIFGSLASGDFTTESDVDIAIISKASISFSDELILTQKLEKLLGRKVDLVILDKDKPLMIHEILCGFPIGLMSDSFCVWFDEIITELQDFCETVKNFV